MSKALISKLSHELETGNLLQFVDDCFCPAQLLKKLGYSENMDKYKPLIKTFLEENEVDFSHWTGNGRPRAREYKILCSNCKVEFTVIGESKKNQKTCSYKCATEKYRKGKIHPNYTTGFSAYRKLALNHYGKQCSLCGYSDERALEVHHRDKDRSNNDISNLEVLCSNCHKLQHL